MSIRTWLYAVAFGVILAGSAQAQQQTQATDDGTAIQSQASEPNPIGIPVRIIEDSESANARNRSERESTDREKDDLVAQERMADATEAMNEATQSMKNAAWWSFGAVAVGTALLTWTLIITRQANIAALAVIGSTEKFGIAQNRPYIQVMPTGAKSHWDESNENNILWKIQVLIHNSGATPATRVSVRTCWRLVDRDVLMDRIPDEVAALKSYVRGGQSISHLSVKIAGEDLDLVRSGQKNLFIFSEVEYGTSLDPKARYITRNSGQAVDITGDPTKYWDDENPVTIDWVSIPSYDCFDGEC